MLIAIDHVLIACRDPDAAAAELEAAVGLHASGGGRHEVPGTFNRLVWLGDSYIELIGVWNQYRASRWWWGQPALDVLARAAGDAAYLGLVLGSDDLAADTASLRARGSVLGEVEEGSRTRPDGRLVHWWSAHEPSPDPDLGLLFLIEHDTTAAEWTPADRAQRADIRQPLGSPARLERVEIPVANTHRATMRVHRDVGVSFRPSLAGGGARDGAVGRQTLRFVPATNEHPPRIVVRGGRESRAVSALGCAWQVEPAVDQYVPAGVGLT